MITVKPDDAWLLKAASLIAGAALPVTHKTQVLWAPTGTSSYLIARRAENIGNWWGPNPIFYDHVTLTSWASGRTSLMLRVGYSPERDFLACERVQVDEQKPYASSVVYLWLEQEGALWSATMTATGPIHKVFSTPATDDPSSALMLADTYLPKEFPGARLMLHGIPGLTEPLEPRVCLDLVLRNRLNYLYAEYQTATPGVRQFINEQYEKLLRDNILVR